MNFLYVLGPAIASIGTVFVWLVRHYKRSIDREARSFREFIIGNVRLRVGAPFSRVLARQLSARRYARRSLERFAARVSIPSVQNFQLEIDRIYIRLSMTAGDQSSRSDVDLLRRGGNASRFAVLIFGEPGSGKSTLTKKLFREACAELYSNPSYGALPIHLELRSIPWKDCRDSSLSPGVWLQDLVSREIDAIRDIHSKGFLYSAFARGQGLLLFLDGLDEVPSDHLSLCCSAIAEVAKDLAGLGGNSCIVVTGRSQLRTVLPRSFVNGFAETFTIRPVSSTDVFAFLRRWPFPPVGRSEQIGRIFASIQASSSLQEMCTNPLVLSMYVARDQLYVSRSGKRPVRLPDTRTDFYQEVVNELLLFRRGEQVANAPVGSQLKRKRENLLGRIALAHLQDNEQPVNSISWTLAVDMTRKVLSIGAYEQAEHELRRLAIETGIFSEERAAESLRFLHLTLCEFLAAKELRESDPSQLSNVMRTMIKGGQQPGSQRLFEVAIFAASLIGRAQKEADSGRCARSKQCSSIGLPSNNT